MANQRRNAPRQQQQDDRGDGLREKMISINRVTKVVKGGRIMGVRGADRRRRRRRPRRHGQGQGEGSAGRRAEGDGGGPPQPGQGAPEEGHAAPRGRSASTARRACYMQPASDGTGIIAGGAMRAVFDVVGVTNVLAKCHGPTNPYNVVRATLNALDEPELAGRHRREARQDGRRDPGSVTMAAKKKIKVTLVKGVAAHGQGDHRDTVRGLGLKWTNHTVEVDGHAVGARHDQQGRLPGEGHRVSADDGAQRCASTRSSPPRAARRPRRVGARHRLGPRQDRRPRPQGPEVALGRLPQGRLRRRPDAAAAPPAEARLRLDVAATTPPRCACATSRSCRSTRSTCSR